MSVSNEMCSRVLHALNEHWRHHCTAPSLRELAVAVDCNSTSVMKLALRSLAESGDIRYSEAKGKARAAIPTWVTNAIRGCVTTRELVTGGWGAFPRNRYLLGHRIDEIFNTEQDAEIEGWNKVYYG